MTTITFNQTDLSNVLKKFDVGVPDVYICIPNTSYEKLKRDYGSGNDDAATQVGSLVVNKTYTVFRGDTNDLKGYLKTKLLSKEEMTYCAVSRKSEGSSSTVFGTIVSSFHGAHAKTGSTLNYSSGNVIAMSSGRLLEENGTSYTTAGSANLNITDASKWALIAGVTTKEKETVYNLNNGQSAISTRLTAKANDFGYIKIGAIENSLNWGNPTDIAIAVVALRALTTNELAIVGANIKKLLPLLQIELGN